MYVSLEEGISECDFGGLFNTAISEKLTHI